MPRIRTCIVFDLHNVVCAQHCTETVLGIHIGSNGPHACIGRILCIPDDGNVVGGYPREFGSRRRDQPVLDGNLGSYERWSLTFTIFFPIVHVAAGTQDHCAQCYGQATERPNGNMLAQHSAIMRTSGPTSSYLCNPQYKAIRGRQRRRQAHEAPEIACATVVPCPMTPRRKQPPRRPQPAAPAGAGRARGASSQRRP